MGHSGPAILFVVDSHCSVQSGPRLIPVVSLDSWARLHSVSLLYPVSHYFLIYGTVPNTHPPSWWGMDLLSMSYKSYGMEEAEDKKQHHSDARCFTDNTSLRPTSFLFSNTVPIWKISKLMLWKANLLMITKTKELFKVRGDFKL